MKKDFSIDFLDFFFKKLKLNKKSVDFKNKFMFPLDDFFFLFFKKVFFYFILNKNKIKINVKLLLKKLLNFFFSKISKFKYNSRDLFYP